jgi:hypothetical protein
MHHGDDLIVADQEGETVNDDTARTGGVARVTALADRPAQPINVKPTDALKVADDGVI